MRLTVHITPRCRRPSRGQVFLRTLKVTGDTFTFVLPSRYFRLTPATCSRVLYASDARTQGNAGGIRLALPSDTGRLVTTATWQVSVPDMPPFDVQHVIQWILPSPLAPLMTDDTWLWPDTPARPALSAGDWPVMVPDPATLQRVRRRAFTVIDNRNRKGYIVRRLQSFPLAPLPEGRYDRLPDVVICPEQENLLCKDTP